MRWIFAIILLLVTIGMVACRATVDPAPRAQAAAQGWVRTADGWERRSDWLPPAQIYQPTLHPLVVGLGEALLVVGTLVALAPKRRYHHPV